jgi:hypothetical protein
MVDNKVIPCITCEHCLVNSDRFIDLSYCSRFTTQEVNYVTGGVTEYPQECSYVRSKEDLCGHSAKGYSPKKSKDQNPQKPMTLWEVFKDAIKELFFAQ